MRVCVHAHGGGLGLKPTSAERVKGQGDVGESNLQSTPDTTHQNSEGWKNQTLTDENQGEENACELKTRGVKMFVKGKGE